jgi:hypothetical protein
MRHKPTSIKQKNIFKKAIELGLSMDMDLAVAKLNLAGVAMSRRRKLEDEPTPTEKIRQARYVERTN